jgi:anthranilate synthase component 1
VLQQLDVDVDFLQLQQSDSIRYPFLLETIAKKKSGEHFDILFAFPQSSLILHDVDHLEFDGPDSLVKLNTNDFLSAFDQWFSAESVEIDDAIDLPFKGGWFVFLGYELVGQIEPSIRLFDKAKELPIAFATRIPTALIRNHVNGKVYIFCESKFSAFIEEIKHDVVRLLNKQSSLPLDPPTPTHYDEEDAQQYLTGVRRIKEYIRQGDVFQVNLSRQWTMEYANDVAPQLLYSTLQRQNPAPFFGLATHNKTAIISSSPERLVQVRDNHIETRPIAGTRPRGLQNHDDQLLQKELIADPKERAEHVMLIDLERNDIGRVCQPGSVRVNESMVVESYAHVHHIVSNICGELRANVTPGAIIRAVFPGGTITGCPKVRCMEIISELEDNPRGAYTGSMGYINRDGGMDLNILIRSMILHKNLLTFRAGAGIVADSDPDKELEETKHKARGLLQALGIYR